MSGDDTVATWTSVVNKLNKILYSGKLTGNLTSYPKPREISEEEDHGPPSQQEKPPADSIGEIRNTPTETHD